MLLKFYGKFPFMKGMDYYNFGARLRSFPLQSYNTRSILYVRRVGNHLHLHYCCSACFIFDLLLFNVLFVFIISILVYSHILEQRYFPPYNSLTYRKIHPYYQGCKRKLSSQQIFFLLFQTPASTSR